jgi:hypothetical protein
MTMQARHRTSREGARPLILIGSAIAPSAGRRRTHPRSGCRVFPASNIWNTRVDALPVHELSDTWLRSASAGSTNLHPDFGPPSYGLPFDVVGRRHAKVHVRFTYAAESDPAPIRSTRERRSRAVRIGTC